MFLAFYTAGSDIVIGLKGSNVNFKMLPKFKRELTKKETKAKVSDAINYEVFKEQ